MKKRISLPWYVKDVLKVLNKADFECFVVGGAIRDSLLKRPVHDYDITTNALPEQVIELFEAKGFSVCPTGLKHGTVTIINGCYNIEVTTYRTDGKYSDNRRPDNVEFVRNLEEDLARRDFTINALAYHPKVGIVDKFNGLQDLNNKVIRCVGDPYERFSEDALRMIRAVRFANQLNFTLDYDLRYHILSLKENLKNVSAERIREELNKILTTKHSIKHLELLKEILPEIFCNHYNFQGNRLLNIDNNGDLVQNLTILFIYDILNLSSLETLKYDNNTVKTIKNAMSCYHIIKGNKSHIMDLKDIHYLLKKEIMSKFSQEEMNIAIGIVLTENSYECEFLYKLLTQTEKIKLHKEPIHIKDLNINGEDIKSLGYSGVEVGQAFDILQRFVWQYPENNKKEVLMKRIKK